jgi:transposase-like protein
MTTVADEPRDGVKLIEIDQGQLQRHVGEVVRATVEETLNALLDAEADALCGARKYERSPDRVDYRAGTYPRQFQTKAGEVSLKVPKLRQATFGNRHVILVLPLS